jgi:hypothetical protein
MRICKRILAGLTLFVCAVGLLLGLAGGIGVWFVKGPVTAKATWVFERIEAALAKADLGLDQAEASLGRAAERLESAREDRKNLAQDPQPSGAARRFLARTVQQRIAPELDDAHEKLHTVAEAAVVVNTVLDDVGSFPFLATSGLDMDRLAEINGRLADVGPAAWELSRLFGEPDADASGQLSRIEQALKTMRRLIAEYKSQVTQVRDRTQALKSRTLPWITPAAALISFACFWIALSQVSLMSHAWSWWKNSGHQELPATLT